MRFSSDHLNPRLFLFESPSGACQRAAGTEARHKVGDRREITQDLLRRAVVVRTRVGCVAVLVQHEKAIGMGFHQLLRATNRAVGAELTW